MGQFFRTPRSSLVIIIRPMLHTHTLFICHLNGRYSDSLRGWTVRGSNPGGGRDFPHPSRPALRPTKPPIQWVLGFFPGVKRPGRGVDHPPLSSAEVEWRVELCIYFPSGPSWPVLGLPLPHKLQNRSNCKRRETITSLPLHIRHGELSIFKAAARTSHVANSKL